MNDKCRLVVLTATLIGALSATACTKPEDKVHEAWSASPTGKIVDDSTLTSTIKSSLLTDPEVNDLDVNIEARNGEVMLSGVVKNQVQMDRVVMLAWMAEGIKKVDNKMSVKSSNADASS